MKSTNTIPGVHLEKLIGKGGMASVYRGKQTYLGRTVAVKIIYPEGDSRQETEGTAEGAKLDQRFQREAKLLADMSQPNIVACYNGGVTEHGFYFLVMEYIDGPNLGQFIRKNGSISERTSLQIVRDITLALDHAYKKGIIHRDVKVENILLQKVEPSEENKAFPFIVKLADLGLARYQEQPDPKEQLTQKGIIFGTPQIMAPEQFLDDQEITFKVDIYALGCLLFQCLHGRAPFDSGSFSAIVAKKITGELPNINMTSPQLHPETPNLIKTLMAYKPDDRPETYSKIAETCSRILDDLKTGIHTIQPQPRRDVLIDAVGLEKTHTMQQISLPLADQKTSTSKLWIGLAAVCLVAFLGFFLWRNQAPDNPVEPPPATVQQQPIQPKSLIAIKLSEHGNTMLGDDFFNRIQDWQKQGSWGPSEDGPGIIGVAGEEVATLTYSAISKLGRWEGTVRLQTSYEAGAGLNFPNGSSFVLRIQNLGESLFCSIASINFETKTLEPVDRKSITVPYDQENISFSLERNADWLLFRVNQQVIGKLPVVEPAESFLIFNEKGVAIFEDLMAFEPLKQ